MSERPFMQLYVSDYFGDTRHLSCEQHGAYLQLLLTMWNAGGSLPDDDRQLARMTSLSVKKWKAIRPVILAFFETEDGQITHHRMTKEIEKSSRQSESRATAGAKGGSATALKNNRSRPANAAANNAAMPQHLPKPYRKEGATALDPTEGAEKLSRYIHTELFEACEKLTEKVPPFQTAKTWPADVIAAARASLAKPPHEAAA
jgi:uncharacterized protein YdaU (DUF1376 family)